MGCQCCRMLKSYIYDPTAPVDVHGRKRDPTESSLYQPHSPAAAGGGSNYVGQKQGFHNLGFSNSNNKCAGGVKPDIDRNSVSRHHGPAAKPERELGRGQGATPRAGEEGGLYILHAEGQVLRRDPPDGFRSVPVYPDSTSLDLDLSLAGVTDSHPDKMGVVRHGQVGCDELDELDEGVGGTPEYLCDTGDEGSVLSADIQTSTASLSSVETRHERSPGDVAPPESRVAVTKSEDEGQGGEEDDDDESVIDSMVAEALAALEAATAGEGYEDYED
ncbi:hypothetical protein DPEC_G00100500 [Dallia pectoralis]|uniref:Uncharacterized protein n=1 Tax=Dallia pectoralis TaxID=75939 RepID=A0ACC2GX22_DALPE|nr:hypothetical protein DPEC_G00100500 [Dallia pectoralis]